jgi:hypothetical protein
MTIKDDAYEKDAALYLNFFTSDRQVEPAPNTVIETVTRTVNLKKPYRFSSGFSSDNAMALTLGGTIFMSSGAGLIAVAPQLIVVGALATLASTAAMTVGAWSAFMGPTRQQLFRNRFRKWWSAQPELKHFLLPSATSDRLWEGFTHLYRDDDKFTLEVKSITGDLCFLTVNSQKGTLLSVHFEEKHEQVFHEDKLVVPSDPEMDKAANEACVAIRYSMYKLKNQNLSVEERHAVERVLGDLDQLLQLYAESAKEQSSSLLMEGLSSLRAEAEILQDQFSAGNTKNMRAHLDYISQRQEHGMKLTD